MRYNVKKLKKALNEPTGFEFEWMTGGVEFKPPAWSWYVMYGLIVVCMWL